MECVLCAFSVTLSCKDKFWGLNFGLRSPQKWKNVQVCVDLQGRCFSSVALLSTIIEQLVTFTILSLEILVLIARILNYLRSSGNLFFSSRQCLINVCAPLVQLLCGETSFLLWTIIPSFSFDHEDDFDGDTKAN